MNDRSKLSERCSIVNNSPNHSSLTTQRYSFKSKAVSVVLHHGESINIEEWWKQSNMAASWPGGSALAAGNGGVHAEAGFLAHIWLFFTHASFLFFMGKNGMRTKCNQDYVNTCQPLPSLSSVLILWGFFCCHLFVCGVLLLFCFFVCFPEGRKKYILII